MTTVFIWLSVLSSCVCSEDANKPSACHLLKKDSLCFKQSVTGPRWFTHASRCNDEVVGEEEVLKRCVAIIECQCVNYGFTLTATNLSNTFF